MANLRNLIDGKATDMQDKDDVFKHLEKTKRAELAYNMEKLKLHTKLAPTRQFMNVVDQEHGMNDANGLPDPNQAGQPNQQQQLNQNQQQKPGQQVNPNAKPGAPNAPGQGQKKAAFPNANKTSTKDKVANGAKKPVGGKKGVEISVKADYHDDPGRSESAGRSVGMSGGYKKFPAGIKQSDVTKQPATKIKVTT